ncbi:MAG: 2,3,4,5-tetrahydropyridine-2,6-dicarboxylate N-acetyltransferase [delta proteobacterium ML8_F1]|nr:MAG: 2,3,4,5-tetrahydropyridine-2,6-dicarboxylate N-acetyltransferase [delta proteobacterium ML8_F1]
MNDAHLLTDPYEIAKFIKDAEKTTPVKAYVKGRLYIPGNKVQSYCCDEFCILVGQAGDMAEILEDNAANIEYYHLENDRRNSAIPLLDLKSIEARIEPGAVIRDHVKIGRNAVIMMGAVINIGAEIGPGTMIDMNAVLGARATIGANAHIGAGAVIAGVLEPPSANPVVIEDNVLIGANAVVLEGVRVGRGAVVAAGSVVTVDVPPETVVAGSPAKIIKSKDDKTRDKTQLLDDLRG